MKEGDDQVALGNTAGGESRTERHVELASIWKASDGRFLRVVSLEPQRIGVRNVATNRLSYMQRRYFENERAGVGWWLEPQSRPLLAVDGGSVESPENAESKQSKEI